MEHLATIWNNTDKVVQIVASVVFFIVFKDQIAEKIFAKKPANGNSYQPQIDKLFDHAKIANEEMGDVKRDISEIKEDVRDMKDDISTTKADIAFIRGKLDK